METTFTASIALATLILFLFKFATHQISKRNLPPGPWGLPIIGHMHHLIGTMPHRGLWNLSKKYGSFMHLQLGEVTTIVVSSSKSAKQVFSSYDLTFADRADNLTAEVIFHSGDIVFSPYGEYWRQLRKICTLELLSAKRVKSFHSLREEECWNFVQDVRSSGSGTPINLSQEIYSRTAVIVSKAAFGKGFKDLTEFTDLIKNILTEMGGFDVADIFPSSFFLQYFSSKKARLHKLQNTYENVVTKVFEESLSNNLTNTKEESLLDVLLRLKDDTEFPLTLDNVKAVILDVFAAGVDTSGATVEWAVSEVIRSPRIMKKLQTELREVLNGKERIREEDIQDLSYLNQVIKETLRLHPPAPFLVARESREPCVLAGYDIPKKTRLLINNFAINRDPEYWNDPESFIPERFENSPTNIVGAEYEYLPFGAGRRMCPGVGLGLANVRLPLATILHHFIWKLPNGANNEDLDMAECFGAVVHRNSELVLVPSF